MAKNIIIESFVSECIAMEDGSFEELTIGATSVTIFKRSKGCYDTITRRNLSSALTRCNDDIELRTLLLNACRAELEPKVARLYYIGAEAGCECCPDHAIIQGFYRREREAAAVAANWLRGNGNPFVNHTNRSQPYGYYKVVSVDAQPLPDGRMVIKGKLYKKDFVGRIKEL